MLLYQVLADVPDVQVTCHHVERVPPRISHTSHVYIIWRTHTSRQACNGALSPPSYTRFNELSNRNLKVDTTHAFVMVVWSRAIAYPVLRHHPQKDCRPESPRWTDHSRRSAKSTRAGCQGSDRNHPDLLTQPLQKTLRRSIVRCQFGKHVRVRNYRRCVCRVTLCL